MLRTDVKRLLINVVAAGLIAGTGFVIGARDVETNEPNEVTPVVCAQCNAEAAALAIAQIELEDAQEAEEDAQTAYDDCLYGSENYSDGRPITPLAASELPSVLEY